MFSPNVSIRLSKRVQKLFPLVPEIVNDNTLNWFIKEFIIPKTSIENKTIFVEPFEYKNHTIFVGVATIKNKTWLEIMLLEET